MQNTITIILSDSTIERVRFADIYKDFKLSTEEVFNIYDVNGILL